MDSIAVYWAESATSAGAPRNVRLQRMHDRRFLALIRGQA